MKKSSRTQQVLNVYGVILIVWSIYRWKVAMPAWVDEFISKPLVFVLPIYILISRLEKKNFFEEIWFNTKKFVSDSALGLTLGSVFIISALFAQYVKIGGINLSLIDSKNIPLALAITLATAISEEILSRGFVLKRFYEETKNPYLSSFNASLLFLILHIPILFTIPELRGTLLILFLTTDFILSLINSFIYLDRRSILAPILIHALYNVAVLLYV